MKRPLKFVHPEEAMRAKIFGVPINCNYCQHLVSTTADWCEQRIDSPTNGMNGCCRKYSFTKLSYGQDDR